MLSLLLATLLTQATMSPTSDLSTNRVRATGAASYRALRDHFADTLNVMDFGADKTGATDSTSAIGSAIAAAPEGGTVWFPAGRFSVTSITAAKSIHLVGTPGSTPTADVFGNAGWASALETGTVIESSITSGTILALGGAAKYYTVDDIIVKGKGDATRTTVCVKADNSILSGHRLKVYNCAVGVELTNDSNVGTLVAPQIRGNLTGVWMHSNANGNSIFGIDASACGTTVQLDATVNSIVGGAIQGSRNCGIRIGGDTNIVSNVYIESSSLATCGISIAGDNNTVDHPHLGTLYDDILVSANDNRIRMGKYNHDVTLLPGTARNIVEGMVNGTYLDQGSNAHVVMTGGAWTVAFPTSSPELPGITRSGSSRIWDHWTTPLQDFQIQVRDDVDTQSVYLKDGVSGSVFMRMRPAGGAPEIGFFGVSPVARPGSGAEIKAALVNLGLLTGGSSSPLNLGGIVAASLPADADGTIRYCSDCTIASPCAGGGTGAIAKRLNGAWVCN